MHCWSLAWRILSIALLACEIGEILRWFEHSLALPFLGIGMKTDLFQSCGHCWVLQICWHIECSTLTASSFIILNNSAGFHHSTSSVHSKASEGLTWLHTPGCLALSEWPPSWLSRSLKLFLYSSSVYSCHLFLIPSASVRSLPFLSFIVPILSRHVPLISPILFKRSLVFPVLLFSSISFYCSLKAVLFLLAVLWNSAFGWVYLSLSPLLSLLFFSQLCVRPPQTTTLSSCISFSWGWLWSLPPIQG